MATVTHRAPAALRLWRWAAAAAVLVPLASCAKPETAKKPAPPQIAGAVQEQGLTTITLSEDSERRLKLLTGLTKIERRAAARLRTVAGEVMLPPGQTIIVSAPLSGSISAVGEWPLAGQNVAAGEALCSFTPLLDPAERIRLAEARVDALRQVASAKVQVEAARVALARAQQLLKSKVGNQRAIDEAQAALNLAEEALETAEARQSLLGGEQFETESGALAARVIRAPLSGVISKVDAAPDELTPQGAPLFEIARHDKVWVRAPVYVGRFREVDLACPAVVKEHAAPAREVGLEAPLAKAPPAANAVVGTVDLFYELPNDDRRFQPGQKLEVTLTLRGAQESLVAPWSAIVYDIHGGAWVYEHVGPQTYARRRVAVRAIDHGGGLALLESGPAEGAHVATTGVVELFGTEFGLSK